MKVVTRSIIAGALAVGMGLTLGAGLQSLAQSQQPVPPTQSPSHQSQPSQPNTSTQSAVPDLPKVYMPGLGEFMLVIQTHHAKLWLAVRAQNWPLAAYQLSEMKEVFSEVQELVPTYKSVPVGQMIDAIITGSIAELEKAVEEKKLRNFSAAYGKLTEACNDCHKAASRGFIVDPPADALDLRRTRISGRRASDASSAADRTDQRIPVHERRRCLAVDESDHAGVVQIGGAQHQNGPDDHALNEIACLASKMF